MKKLYILSSLICCFLLATYSQVGINTKSPTGIFHIDPKGDSPTSTTDDMIVTAAGNMGLGTVSPQAKMHINTTSSQTALRIVNGKQANDLVLVSADATGGVTWGAIKGSGGETFASTVAQTFAGGVATKVYISGTTTRYNVRGTGPHLVYFRWWGRVSASSGMASTYIRLLKNGTTVDTLEYYTATAANTPFSLTVALMANCTVGDYLELTLSPSSGANWTSQISPSHTRLSATFFLM